MPSVIELVDDEIYVPKEVQLLLDAQIFFQALQPGRVQLFEHGPYLQNTEFGNRVAGRILSSSIPMYCNATLFTNFHINKNISLEQFC